MSENEPLHIATEHYYFKPMCAVLYSFVLRSYSNAGCRLESPVLDLGCSDGNFGIMLTRMLGQPESLVGLDIDIDVLKKAKVNEFKPYSLFIQSSSANLPFADSSFSTVFSNHVFQSINDLPATLREIKRVLTSDGQFYCTIQTNLFREHYLIGRLLKWLGFERAAESYLKRIDRRLRQVNVSFSPTKWADIFTESGLRVNKVTGYYPLKLMSLWRLLLWTPMRIFGFLKLIRFPSVHRMAENLQRRIFIKSYLGTRNDTKPEECELILICANK